MIRVTSQTDKSAARAFDVKGNYATHKTLYRSVRVQAFGSGLFVSFEKFDIGGPMSYSVQKDGHKWIVLNSADSEYRRYFARKKDALEAIPNFEKEDRHVARLFAMQESGVYEWTPEESTEIDKLAEAIRNKEVRPTFSGKQTVEEISRKEQVSDSRTVASWHALGPVSGHGKQICAEIAWRQKARLEAFERAGLAL